MTHERNTGNRYTKVQWADPPSSQEKYKDLPLIMATAQADKGQQITIMEAGGNGHVPKPFDAEQIKIGIEKALNPEVQKVDNTRNRKIVDNKVELTVAHIQITDHLVLGALKHRIEKGEVIPEYFDLKTDKKGAGIPFRMDWRRVKLTVRFFWRRLPWTFLFSGSLAVWWVCRLWQVCLDPQNSIFSIERDKTKEYF